MTFNNYEEFENLVDTEMAQATDGNGNPIAFIELPNEKIAEITFEDSEYYSCILHDSDGYPQSGYINTDTLYDMFMELKTA